MKKPNNKAKKASQQQQFREERRRQQQEHQTSTPNKTMNSTSTFDQPVEGTTSPTTQDFTTPSTLGNKHRSIDDSMVIYTNNPINQSPIPSSTPPPPSSIIHNQQEEEQEGQDTTNHNQSIMDEDEYNYIMVPSQVQNMTLNSSTSSTSSLVLDHYDYFGSPMMTMMSTPPSTAYQHRYEQLQSHLMDESTSGDVLTFYSPNTPQPIQSETPCIIKKSLNQSDSSNVTTYDVISYHQHPNHSNASGNYYSDDDYEPNDTSFVSTNTTLNSSKRNNMSLQLDLSQINEMSSIPNSVIEQKLKELKYQIHEHHHNLKSPSNAKVTSPSHSLHKNYTATVDTDRILSHRSNACRRAMHVHREDILKYVRAVHDPDDQVRRRAIEIIKVLDATMKPPSPEKVKKNPNFEHIQPRVSHNPKTIPKEEVSTTMYQDFKSKLKMTRKATSRFRECFDQSTSPKTLTRREQVELEKQEFKKKCPQKSHK